MKKEDIKNVVAENEEATENTNAQPEQTEEKPAFQFDYDKLAEIVSGKQSVTEDKVLSGYFKEHGLSGEEMEQAINSFKEQKAKNTPDVNAMQGELSKAMEKATQSEIQSKAMLMASELGVEIKAVPYIIRMADTSSVAPNGVVNEEELKKSLNEVIDAIPSLKQTVTQGGFQVVGAETNQQTDTNDDELKRIFGVKK